MMVDFETVIFEKRNGIAWVTLNRPAMLNAINLAMRDELWTVLDAVDLDPEIGVVVFKGAGERAFSAGADISEFGTAPSYVAARRARLERDLWGRLARTEKPLIAAIQGYALGAGFELSLLCDFRLASDDARLGLPEVALGYIPTAGGTQTLPRTVGRGQALDLVLTGDPIAAPQAFDWGILHWLGPSEDLYPQANALAIRLLATPQDALRLAKRALVEGRDVSLAEGLSREAHLRSLLVASR